MRYFLILILILLFTTVVYLPSLFNFFAQDDFIFIKQFSQNSLALDLRNTFGPPVVTHWRPLHNAYFLISGNVFGTNYFGYHLFTLLLHTFTAFFIYIIYKNLFRQELGAISASLIYAVHPAHFVALFWISGAAINIGFFLFVLSLYCFLTKRLVPAIFLYSLSLLASEAILVGLFIYLGILIFRKQFKTHSFFILTLFIISIIFLVFRFVFLKPPVTSDEYQVMISGESVGALRYYILRTGGFVEGYGRTFLSLALVLWLVASIFVFFKLLKKRISQFLLLLFIIAVGFFPFVFIPNHLSAHYMAVAVWGFSMLMGTIISSFKKPVSISLLISFILFSFFAVRLEMKNSWVINRSNLAHKLIGDIELRNLPEGTALIFDDNELASSLEQYISLGSGEAVNVWFFEKNYKTCFSFFERCSSN